METAPLTSVHHTADRLAEGGMNVAYNDQDNTFQIIFDDADQALAEVDKVKTADWVRYLRNGGNPRNKRSHGAQYASVKKAIAKVAGR